MKLHIVKYPNEVLTTKCNTITKNSKELQKLISDMFDTLLSTTGIGLAAPQVGFDIRLFITYYGNYVKTRKVYINPVITKYDGGIDYMQEGCLSLPGKVYNNVSRYNHIIIEYLNENFEEKVKEYSGYHARLVQHEYDHMKGITLANKLKIKE